MGIQAPQNDKAKSKAARARTSENNEHRPRTQAWQISETTRFLTCLGIVGCISVSFWQKVMCEKKLRLF
jgi:hypothetical protein